MKKVLIFAPIILIIAGLLWMGLFYYNHLRGVGPAINKPPADIVDIIDEHEGEVVEGTNSTDFPLVLPEGFSISIFAKDLVKPRDMAIGPQGNMWVSKISSGEIVLLEIEDGEVVNVSTPIRGLSSPHGLAFDPGDPYMLYFAEERKISRIRVYSDGPAEKLIDLPAGGNHKTRTIRFGPDDLLYISIGSSCNVCDEPDERHAKIFTMNRDGSNFTEYASGLRNSVFFTWSYVDGRMWATDNGRDLLGDDVPPDEINIIEEGKNYGWPTCYGKNIHDTQFDKKTYIRNPCLEPFEMPSYVDLQAHVAPLGLAFVPEEGWPEEYWYDLLVAEHGSWNRTIPVGYKISRIRLDADGTYHGTEDFISGWLTPEGALGRPVNVLTQPGGILYISDDKAGVIYKVTTNLE